MGIRHKQTKKCVQSSKGFPAEVFVSVCNLSLGDEGFYPTRGRKSITSDEPEALSYKSASFFFGGGGGGHFWNRKSLRECLQGGDLS